MDIYRRRNIRNMWRTNGRMNFPTNGLVFYLPLWHPDKKTSPITAWDVANNTTHSCTVVGATWGTTGRTFDGSDDNITLEYATSLAFTNKLSLSTWVNITDTNSGTGIIYYMIGDWWLAVNDTTDDVQFRVYDVGGSSEFTDAYSGKFGAWRHLVFTWDGSLGSNNAKLYIDNVAKTPVNYAGTITTDEFDAYIGRWSNESSQLTGTIGELLLYNRILSAVEISHIYNATKWRYS